MKQFIKNVFAMLLLALSLCLVGALISFVFSLLSALSIGWLIVLALLFGFLIMALCFGLMGSAMSYPIKLINNSKSGKVFCSVACLYSIVYNIMSTIELVNENNASNNEGQTQFLILQIISCIIIVLSIGFCLKIIWGESEKVHKATNNEANNIDETSKVSAISESINKSQIAKNESKTGISLKQSDPLLSLTDKSWSGISLFDDEQLVISKTIKLGLWTKEEKNEYFKENHEVMNVSREISNSISWVINCENKIGCDIKFSFKRNREYDIYFLDSISLVYHSNNQKEERMRLITLLSKKFEVVGSIDQEPCVFAPPLANVYVSTEDNEINVVVFYPTQMLGLF